jgi:hypothetical protein
VSAVRCETGWSLHGYPALVLRDQQLRVELLPTLGGKIWQITHQPTGRDLLWQHPRMLPRTVPFRAGYDDVFFGGWDELFPNDMPETLAGEAMPDHGELWSIPWHHAVVQHADAASVHLWVETPISAVRFEKWVTLHAGEARIETRYRIHNASRRDLPFLWKLHVAMQVNEYSVLDLGATTMYIEDFGPPRGGTTGVSYQWPHYTDASGTQHDMRRCLGEDAQINEFQYATTLHGGWCALTHAQEQLGLALTFDRAVLPSFWVFASYGGWRNLQTLVLEPCTGYPIGVAQGVAQGTHQILRAGQTIETSVQTIVYRGISAVADIVDGQIIGREI